MFCEVPRFLLPMSYSIQQKSTTEYLFIAVLMRSELFLDLGFYESCLEHSFLIFADQAHAFLLGIFLAKELLGSIACKPSILAFTTRLFSQSC